MNKKFLTLDEISWVNDIDLQKTKFRFSPEVYTIFKAMFGFDFTKESERKAHDFVLETIKEDKKYCIAFFVCPEYCNQFRKFLEKSYNCYKVNSEPRMSKDFFKRHFVVCEALYGCCIPYNKEGLTILDYKEAFAMKFDMIVTNPPYDKSLHLHFLNLGLDALKEKGEMVIIEPATWLINVRKNGKAKMYDAIKKRIEGHVKSVKIENLNNDFNIGMNVPLSITMIDFSRDYPTIDFVCCGKKRVVRSIYDCNLIGEYKTIWGILDKIQNKMKEIGGDMMNKHTTKEKKGTSLYLKYCDIVSAPMGAYGSSAEAMMDLPCFMIETGLGKFASTYISGGFSQVDSTLYSDVPFAKKRGASKQLSDHPATCVYGTKSELENWKHFIFNNKLALFINIVLTIDQNNNSKEFLPWLVDKQYTDEEINKMFDFTEEEIALIDKTLKKFERHSSWFKRYMCGPADDSTTKSIEADVADIVKGA